MKVTHSCPTLQPNGLYSPWTSPGKNTGVGSLSLLQGIFPTQGLNPGLLHCGRLLYQPREHEDKKGSSIEFLMLESRRVITFLRKEKRLGIKDLKKVKNIRIATVEGRKGIGQIGRAHV